MSSHSAKTKMSLYVMFPVATFYFFNKPELFEEYVTGRVRQLYPPEDKMQKRELQKLKEKMQVKYEAKVVKENEAQRQLFEAKRKLAQS
ncbi:hypothetical protein BSL78_03335 [Apostichopus japonicus]|uniref:Uncharacterized protein n=1 Tax=Stichopus japonicus TaxID=307972 RepID=A0A2G8LHN9_STIJA|nr:hypothetical protein BSL78_03335 [Apostichopus japonicus]